MRASLKCSLVLSRQLAQKLLAQMLQCRPAADCENLERWLAALLGPSVHFRDLELEVVAAAGPPADHQSQDHVVLVLLQLPRCLVQRTRMLTMLMLVLMMMPPKLSSLEARSSLRD